MRVVDIYNTLRFDHITKKKKKLMKPGCCVWPLEQGIGGRGFAATMVLSNETLKF